MFSGTFITGFCHHSNVVLFLMNCLWWSEAGWTEVFKGFEVAYFPFDLVYEMFIPLYTGLAGRNQHISELLVPLFQLGWFLSLLVQLHLKWRYPNTKGLKSFMLRNCFIIWWVMIGMLARLIFSVLFVEGYLLVLACLVLDLHRRLRLIIR
jgi:hypothetical protein